MVCETSSTTDSEAMVALQAALAAHKGEGGSAFLVSWRPGCAIWASAGSNRRRCRAGAMVWEASSTTDSEAMVASQAALAIHKGEGSFAFLVSWRPGRAIRARARRSLGTRAYTLEKRASSSTTLAPLVALVAEPLFLPFVPICTLASVSGAIISRAAFDPRDASITLSALRCIVARTCIQFIQMLA